MQFLNYVTRVTSLLALYSREKTIKFNRDF